VPVRVRVGGEQEEPHTGVYRQGAGGVRPEAGGWPLVPGCRSSHLRVRGSHAESRIAGKVYRYVVL